MLLGAMHAVLSILTVMQKSTKAILDHFVVGKTKKALVICEIIDADENGTPPNENGFDRTSQSLLDVIVETNNEVLISHVYYIHSNVFDDHPCILI